MNLTNKELNLIIGGSTSWTTVGNLVLNGLNFLVSLGRQLGSSVAYLIQGKKC